MNPNEDTNEPKEQAEDSQTKEPGVSPKQIADLFDVHIQTVYAAIRRGRLPVTRISPRKMHVLVGDAETYFKRIAKRPE